MKVFMSWSGDRSKAAAELLYGWVKCVIQASRPWISTRGIGSGTVWFSEINNELKDASVGIICLTHENKNAPWILFEAGALAKGLTTNKVCTFLIDLGTSDIRDPLAQFNHTLPTKDGLMGLAVTLNSASQSPLDSNTLTAVFDAFWPQFEISFKAMLERLPQVAKIEEKSDSNILEAILESTRGLSQRIRLVEERNEAQLANAVSNAWPFPTSARPPDSSNTETIEIDYDAAKKVVMDFAALGLTRDQAYSRLSRRYGSRRASRIMKHAEETFPPVGFADQESAR